jgi:hypothetical protein
MLHQVCTRINPVTAPIRKLVFCQSSNCSRETIKRFFTQMSATEAVIFPSVVVLRFCRCVTTLSQTFCSTKGNESEVISSKRRALGIFRFHSSPES